ncbi:patatin-like phospholipase family protein [Flavobacterium sp. RNTU_13]|uniref:patatin-like phospholipase family protein n=1 Tax=Flavobacterium sp. RNTU_13 TaxID=3375145 RepID=UPI0039878508
MNSKDTFYAGICMAGAVSAGAYTAGVMDYLLEALEHWEKAKKLQDEGKLTGVPKHNFLIEVLGGASAGGMTAAITAAGIQEDFKPVTAKNYTDENISKNNPLYNSWVNLKEGTDSKGKHRDMMDLLLDTADIEADAFNPSKEVRAGFNSNFIKDIADSMLDKRVSSIYKRPYIAPGLEVFTTLTNLRGFAYKVQFKTSTGLREHRMRMHRDYAFFKIDESADDSYLSADGRIPVHFNAPDGLNTGILKQAAMSTGAFPVGLESRELTRARHYIEKSKYINLLEAEKVEYHFLPEGDFVSLNVDGGVINNEPYEITEQLLEDRREARLLNEYQRLLDANDDDINTPPFNVPEIARDATNFESIVLMIDPFPSDDINEDAFRAQKAWRNVLPTILSAMRSQLMMKDEQIKRAYLDEDYTRFLIMPQRTDENHEDQKYTIACGSLGGFGGFFSKEFRKHDYFLGRRNCQRFLQRHFTVAANAHNPILDYGYGNGATWGKVKLKVKSASGTERLDDFYCILPDLRVMGNEADGYTIVAPDEEIKVPYPSIKLSYILGLRDKIIKRIKCVMDNVQNAEPTPPAPENPVVARIRRKGWFGRQIDALFKRPAVKAYISIAKNAGKGQVADFFIDSIIRDMDTRGLLDDDVKK